MRFQVQCQVRFRKKTFVEYKETILGASNSQETSIPTHQTHKSIN